MLQFLISCLMAQSLIVADFLIMNRLIHYRSIVTALQGCHHCCTLVMSKNLIDISSGDWQRLASGYGLGNNIPKNTEAIGHQGFAVRKKKHSHVVLRL
jgi:hypothetical protein